MCLVFCKSTPLMEILRHVSNFPWIPTYTRWQTTFCSFSNSFLLFLLHGPLTIIPQIFLKIHFTKPINYLQCCQSRISINSLCFLLSWPFSYFFFAFDPFKGSTIAIGETLINLCTHSGDSVQAFYTSSKKTYRPCISGGSTVHPATRTINLYNRIFSRPDHSHFCHLTSVPPWSVLFPPWPLHFLF